MEQGNLLHGKRNGNVDFDIHVHVCGASDCDVSEEDDMKRHIYL